MKPISEIAAKITELASIRSAVAISIYIPMTGKSPEREEAKIRLKNRLVEAETQLLSRGIQPETIKKVLRSARRYVEDAAFWMNASPGFGFFITLDSTEAVRIPFTVPELFYIDSRFNVRPLVRAMNSCLRFYVLALEIKYVRLIHVTPQGAVEMAVPGIPVSLEAFSGMEESEKTPQGRTAGRVGAAGSFIRHGGGDKGVEQKGRLHRFCVAIDHALCSLLASSHEPLVLVGTSEILDSYRRVSSYPHLLAQGIERSPKMLTEDMLASLAQPIADQSVDIIRQEAIRRFEADAGTGLASQQVEEILQAAHQGRVAVLLTEDQETSWGHYDPEGQQVVVHRTQARGDEDLVNCAVLETLEHGGKVFSITPEEINAPVVATALFRY